MNLVELREELRVFRERVESVAQERKDTYYVLDQLYMFYHQASAENRALIESVFCEWLDSENESMRFDAIAMINKIGLRQAIPKLRQLAMRLKNSKEPGALYEIKKIDRSLAALIAE